MLEHTNDFTMIHSIKLTGIFRAGQSFIRDQFNILPYGQPCVFMKTKNYPSIGNIHKKF